MDIDLKSMEALIRKIGQKYQSLNIISISYQYRGGSQQGGNEFNQIVRARRAPKRVRLSERVPRALNSADKRASHGEKGRVASRIASSRLSPAPLNFFDPRRECLGLSRFHYRAFRQLLVPPFDLLPRHGQCPFRGDKLSSCRLSLVPDVPSPDRLTHGSALVACRCHGCT